MKMPSGHFCGIRLKSDLVSDFTFIELLYLPNQKYSKHSHERATLCLVLQGNFTETYGRNSLTCVPSTLLFYPAGPSFPEAQPQEKIIMTGLRKGRAFPQCASAKPQSFSLSAYREESSSAFFAAITSGISASASFQT